MKTIISKLRTTCSFALTIASIGLLGLMLSVSHFRSQVVSAQQLDYAKAKAKAEQEYAAGSYARAYDIYAKVSKTGLPAAEARWIDFRLADTGWRAQAGSQTSDTTKSEQAIKQLDELIRVNDKQDDRDVIWAEAHESLGDLYWTRRGAMNWGLAWPHYQQALDWWAGQPEIDRARSRYLKIVFKAAEPPRADEYYFYTYYGNYIPLDILENALKISAQENDQAHLHFLIAMTMRATGGDWATRERVPDEFEAALKSGKKTDWYDDALFYYAEWMTTNGSINQTAAGQWQQEPDYVKALELYRRFVREFVKGESRYYDQALERIKNITDPSLSIGASNIFLPDSELQYVLSARNLRRVDFALYQVDLTRDVRFTKLAGEDEGEGESDNNWVQRIQVAGRPPIKTWFKDLKSREDHKPVTEQLRIEGKLPVGAYLLEARSGSSSSRDVVMITDAAIVLKSSAKQALVYFCNAVTGAPIPNAAVALWESYYANQKWHWRKQLQTTNKDGLAPFAMKGADNSHSLFASAVSGERQAFSNGYANSYDRADQAWKIYAFTDRPAYRPKETVQWKFIARRFADGVYSTPANQVVEYQINNPQGAKISEGKATLNAFGAAWSSLELSDQLPLGEYQVQFWDQGRANQIGDAKLFRLEEYKLPEFKVAVKTPEENGRKKSFRLGEKVEVNIQADYYFGGPVSNASVEVVVYQTPFYHYWYPRHDYSWYYDDIEQQGRYYYGGQGQAIKRETIKTDATGKATITFDTPRENYNQDFQYRVEARVTDSSRREIIASDTVRVTRQRYFVYPRPERNIYRPKDKVTVDIKALDANEQPVLTEGTVKVTRDYWYEVWLDPNGREVKGEELRSLREKSFPPALTKGQSPWQLKFRGYQHDDILTQKVKTDAEGSAQLNFTPERDGYYRVTWESSQGNGKRGRFLPPITAETTVMVATNATTELGYRPGGVEIIVDKDTFRSGQTAPVMISVPTNDRYVLFSVEGQDLYSYQLIHVTGTAKLIELPIEEKHVPNIYLTGTMVSDAQMFVDTKQVVVPPVQQFLSVDVKADREQYQPREEGSLQITTRDANGKPVSAEIALGLIDESVKYIQQDYAGDPRQFYYGTKRAQTVQTQSTFNQKSYASLVEVAKGQLRDRKDLDREDDERRQAGEGGKDKGEGYRAEFGANRSGDVTRIDGLADSEKSISSGVPAAKPVAAPASGALRGAKERLVEVPGQEPAVQV